MSAGSRVTFALPPFTLDETCALVTAAHLARFRAYSDWQKSMSAPGWTQFQVELQANYARSEELYEKLETVLMLEVWPTVMAQAGHSYVPESAVAPEHPLEKTYPGAYLGGSSPKPIGVVMDYFDEVSEIPALTEIKKLSGGLHDAMMQAYHAKATDAVLHGLQVVASDFIAKGEMVMLQGPSPQDKVTMKITGIDYGKEEGVAVVHLKTNLIDVPGASINVKAK